MIMHTAEIHRRLTKGELVINPRKRGTKFAIEGASYDLIAGRALWKDVKDGKTAIEERAFDPSATYDSQATVQLQPGQMMWVITYEELNIPIDCCATVYSKNNLAMAGIFAFNAGHVDPGYRGPIVIRLISLRATPYTIAMGQPIFTVVFETLDRTKISAEPPNSKPGMTPEEALVKVRTFADVALSNALFELYAEKIESRLSDYKRDTLNKLRTEIEEHFVREDKLNSKLWIWFVGAVLTMLGLGATILAIINNLARLKGLLP